MVAVKIVTINILNDLSRWKERSELLLTGLAELDPDLVAIQEVRLPEDPAQWLANRLGYTHLYASPKSGFERSHEAIAILSRLPFSAQNTLELDGQQRVAQYIRVELAGEPLIVVNGHFYWQPGASATRQQQISRLLSWLQAIPENPHCVVCGDFNSTPDTPSIQRMQAGWEGNPFRSAYAVIHGTEPGHTCPTPLPRSNWARLRTFLGFFLLMRPGRLDRSWRGTLDYIFVSPRVRVRDCRVVLDQPATGNSKIYPSDHFGLTATLELGPNQ